MRRCGLLVAGRTAEVGQTVMYVHTASQRVHDMALQPIKACVCVHCNVATA